MDIYHNRSIIERCCDHECSCWLAAQQKRQSCRYKSGWRWVSCLSACCVINCYSVSSSAVCFAALKCQWDPETGEAGLVEVTMRSVTTACRMVQHDVSHGPAWCAAWLSTTCRMAQHDVPHGPAWCAAWHAALRPALSRATEQQEDDSPAA